ncbi:hypothetical protein UY3_04428 [Chelonia mydas]|uniref:Myb/SANT-like DNA-binding domain-containing protein n=1 Tax=Chelonia mydas TaxID=8469 RepID=M7BRL1_CHEMY|nr:hypothetical protein UY3_04428 [Chelonia mydas]
MPPCARRAPVWSNGEVLGLISVRGEEAVQSQMHSSHRNYDTFGQISRYMMDRGQDRDGMQCRVKVKELQNAYCKACEANGHSGAAPLTCRCYKELDTILGGNPTFTPTTTMDTSPALLCWARWRRKTHERVTSDPTHEEEMLHSLSATNSLNHFLYARRSSHLSDFPRYQARLITPTAGKPPTLLPETSIIRLFINAMNLQHAESGELGCTIN